MRYGKTRKQENRIFHSNAVLVHCLNSASCLISAIVLTHYSHSSLNLVINALSSGMLGGMVQDKWSRECCRNWTALHA